MTYTLLIVISGLAIAAGLVIWLVIWRWRRVDPDRGGEGYTPIPGVVVPPYRGEDRIGVDAEDAWLLGFAAPHAVRPGLDDRAWDLGRSADTGGFGIIAGLVAAAGVTASRWAERERAASEAITRTYTPAERAWAVSEYAWLQRLAVAGGVQSADAARQATKAATAHLDSTVTDWLRFGDLIDEALARRPSAEVTPPRMLYRPGAPWAQPGWPMRR